MISDDRLKCRAKTEEIRFLRTIKGLFRGKDVS